MPKEGRYWSSNPIASIWACELQPFSRTSRIETFRGNWSLAAKTKERVVFAGRLSFVQLRTNWQCNYAVYARSRDIKRSFKPCFLSLFFLRRYKQQQQQHQQKRSKDFDWSQIRLHFKWHRPKIQTAVRSLSNDGLLLQYIHGTSLADNYYQPPLYFDFLAGYRMNYRKILRIMLVFRSC